jgi:hypothetical protein
MTITRVWVTGESAGVVVQAIVPECKATRQAMRVMTFQPAGKQSTLGPALWCGHRKTAQPFGGCNDRVQTS